MKILVVGAAVDTRAVIEQGLAPVSRLDFVPDVDSALRRCAGAFVQGDPYQLLCVETHDGGTELLARLRAWEAHRTPDHPIPVLLITSHQDVEHITGSLRRCRSYLLKPFAADELLQRLETLDLIQVALTASTR